MPKNSLGTDFRRAIESQRKHLKQLLARLTDIDTRLATQIKADEICQRLQKLEGIQLGCLIKLLSVLDLFYEQGTDVINTSSGIVKKQR